MSLCLTGPCPLLLSLKWTKAPWNHTVPRNCGNWAMSAPFGMSICRIICSFTLSFETSLVLWNSEDYRRTKLLQILQSCIERKRLLLKNCNCFQDGEPNNFQISALKEYCYSRFHSCKIPAATLIPPLDPNFCIGFCGLTWRPSQLCRLNIWCRRPIACPMPLPWGKGQTSPSPPWSLPWLLWNAEVVPWHSWAVQQDKIGL